MKQITVRNIPDTVEERLRTLARHAGKSLNQTVVQLLADVTGGKRADRRRRDLSAIAARWNDEEADAFDRATRLFEAVDDEVWR